MADWVAKRFWTDVAVVPQDVGFAVQLDGRPVKTPAKSLLALPTQTMASAVADEWRAVDQVIDPTVMPFTRSANAALDKVAPQFDEVATMLAAYGESDLLCYRADHPEELVVRQADHWDPMLDWAHEVFGARLVTTVGIMPVSQPENAVKLLTAPLFSASEFELAAFHDLIAMSGSLVLALGVALRRLTPAQAWDLSRLDENWQSEQWGIDEDAAQVAEIKRTAFEHAATFFDMST